MKKTVASDKWLVTSEPQAALLDPPELHAAHGCCEELPEFIAERRARVARRQRCVLSRPSPAQQAASPEDAQRAAELPEPRWDSPGLAEWRAQQRAARLCAWLLGVLLVGGFALIGLAAVAANLGWIR